jgi:hypothetical protein
MPFDPTKPADHSEIQAAELRGQLMSLKALIDNRPDRLEIDSIVNSNTAVNVDTFTPLSLTISNPPTQGQIQAIVDKLNQLIGALQH